MLYRCENEKNCIYFFMQMLKNSIDYTHVILMIASIMTNAIIINHPKISCNNSYTIVNPDGNKITYVTYKCNQMK